MDLILTALHCVVLTVPESEQLLVKWLQLDSGREYTEEELTVILQSATSESMLVHRSVRTHCVRHTHTQVSDDTVRHTKVCDDTQVRDETVCQTQTGQ